MRFLIIDDSTADSRVLQAMLSQACRYEFEVVHVLSGTEGLARLQNQDFDCVFLDYRLEDSQKWEYLEKIRASGNDVPIIAISGDGNEQIAVEGLKLGAQDYLVKDALTAETVHRALSNAIEKVELSREVARRQQELHDFAHMAAHDLQAPLRRIAQLSEFLKEDLAGKLDETCEMNVDLIGTNARRLQSLVQSLIEFARYGSIENRWQPVSLEQIRDSALFNLDFQIRESEATIQSEPLPDVLGDETTLTLLFQNLMSNAIKFRGDRTPVINISAKRAGEHQWLVSFSDNGIGIKQEYLDKIFIPFQRLHAQREYEGSGIGLATCRKIVEQHRGQIKVESEPGIGSTFHFTISAPPS
ncbi:hybrid sensor histidine kinase/response regulator [Bremerella cremea]|uniref:histidine kinase n=1 Tax=Bremerella cremea TaxID=1031537 RepID=A0A368KPH5_9BACT|nr:hybrid sensor histidine kinase/response regulator [Bremerella cremea]RCS46453.1 hybrid sensor histidine kinase/response regulator [Bremerella cremea]